MTIPTPKMLAIFTEQWECLMGIGRVRAGLHLQSLAQIVAAYSEPHRHYHNLDHIVHLLDMLMMRHEAEPHQRLALYLAAVFHDIVYDTRSSENEARSAKVAEATLNEIGLRGLSERVGRWILMTKDHQAPDDHLDAQVLLDADLSILGMGPIAYAEYAKAIRREYEWVSEPEYLTGRRKVLSGFLARSAIYRTDSFKRWETPARRNIAGELAEIDAKLRTLE